jgi:pyruvate,water dikinase
MQKKEKAILWFSEVAKDDIPLVGGKGANLGEMSHAQIPVPPGFVVSASAFFNFIKGSDLAKKIKNLLANLDAEDNARLQETANRIKELILNTPMPQETAEEIKKAYRKLGQGLVAVRSSATAEDLPEASFAGQQSTFLNVEGEDNVVAAVQKCWASLFEPRAIYYREQQGFDQLSVGIAVPIQKMVQSSASGVIFTLEPITGNRNIIVIEAVYGLGEALVAGEVKPDLYMIAKDKMVITSKRISHQERKLVFNPNGKNGETNVWQLVTPSKQEQQKIPDADILKLTEIALRIENHYQSPQDIEWAQENSELYIVQTRPITTVGTAQLEPEIDAPVLLVGDAASPGLATGPAKIIRSAREMDKVNRGDVMVTEMTAPDFVPAMKRAAAIVTDRGGRTSHAAIVSRELSIPCVVGAGEATSILRDGQVITVDGSHGKVYSGTVTRKTQNVYTTNFIRDAIKTKTRVYVNLAQPELAEAIASRNVDGVGLLRAEFIISQIGEHPRYALKQNRGEEFTQKLAQGLRAFAAAFNPRPVVYRTTDFKTNEYRELTGGEEFEEFEENPMLGYRGASRYITDIDSFRLELDAIKMVRREFKNLWVMIPFVRTVQELARTKEIMEKEGLVRSGDFKLWMMVEVPSNIFLIDKFLDVGIDGISIGSNDLTQLILGVDRDNEKLAGVFDERNEAVLIAMEKAIKTATNRGVTASICGQAPSVYPDLTEKLVSWGITSVSVSPDMIGTTREIIARVEAKLGIHA